MTELVKVYSPTGEMFENSPANARDLVIHVGWSYEKPADYVESVTVTEEVAQVEISEDVLADKADEVDEQEDSEAEGEEVKASGRGRKKKV